MMAFRRTLYRWQHDARQRVSGVLYAVRHTIRRPPPSAPGLAGSPRRVLFVVAGHFGDTVMCTPVLAEARRLWPTAELVVLGRPANNDLLGGDPAVSSFLAIRAFPFTFRRRAEVRATAAELRSAGFDVGVLLLGDQFAKLLADAGIPVRVGRRGSAGEAFLTHTYSIEPVRSWGPAERLGALQELGLSVDSTVRPRLWVDQATQRRADVALGRLGITARDPIAVLHPFGSQRRQWWPIERVTLLSQRLREQTGLRTLIVGGQELRGVVNVPSGVIDAVGELSIAELKGAIRRAAIVISTDSAPYHMAGALDRPTVGLFRNERADYADRYVGAKSLLGRHPVCAKTCRWDSCAVIPCRELAAISTESVIEAAVQLHAPKS